jgi:hypothetical protein
MPEVRSLAGSVISRAARPVAAPPSADPIASTSDLYFELETRGVMLRPGERVSVVFPTPTTGRNLQVPWASIVHDAHGGAWVYESLGDGKYRRRRVDVRNVQNGIAILARGPEPGTRVVTTGAAELFGTEFGAGH